MHVYLSWKQIQDVSFEARLQRTVNSHWQVISIHISTDWTLLRHANILKFFNSATEERKLGLHCCSDLFGSWDSLFRLRRPFGISLIDAVNEVGMFKHLCKMKRQISSRQPCVLHQLMIKCTSVGGDNRTTARWVLCKHHLKFMCPCHSVCIPFPPSSNIFNEFAQPDLPPRHPARLVVDFSSSLTRPAAGGTQPGFLGCCLVNKAFSSGGRFN